MNRIKELRQSKGLTLKEMSQDLNISDSAISLYENEKRSLDAESISRLANYFNVTTDYLLGLSDNLIAKKAKETISVLGKVPAGIPVEAIEYVIDEIDLSPNLINDHHEYFALLVTGNSMYPEYLDGDIVVVRKDSTAETGDDIVAFIGSCDATLKRLQKYQTGIRLKALNPEYESRTFTNDEIENLPVSILGVVVELRRKKK